MSALVVTAARPEERAEVLSLLFSRHRPLERAARVEDVLLAADLGDLSLEGLLVVRRDGEAVGALLGVFPEQPGGTAFLWPPAVLPGPEADAVADALLQEAARRIDRSGAALGQCLLEAGEESQRECLIRNGFVQMADLLRLERRLDQPLPGGRGFDLERTPFRGGATADRFARVLERTYLGTLDCPGMVGTRSGREALESYRWTGEFDPRRWSIFALGGADIGVLLLTDHPDEDAWEIVYVGVVPEARGRGYGRALVLEALRRASAAGRAKLTLAVDTRNRFAQRIYDELGFERVAVQSAFVRAGRRGA